MGPRVSINDYQVGKRVLSTMMVFTVGCIVDHVTTYYGLTLPNVEELNKLVLMLIETGLWNLFEVSLLFIGNVYGIFVSSSKSKIMVVFSLTLLFLVGIVRLSAGFHNMMIIFNVVYL
jgi:hypothetical protein